MNAPMRMGPAKRGQVVLVLHVVATHVLCEYIDRELPAARTAASNSSLLGALRITAVATATTWSAPTSRATAVP
jgi:hypothetical protein